jgi:hypothetical protein
MLTSVPVVAEVRAVHKSEIRRTAGERHFNGLAALSMTQVVLNELHPGPSWYVTRGVWS